MDAMLGELDTLEEDVDDLSLRLGSSNSVHDRTQFESKFDFDLANGDRDQKAYEIDMYMFIPATIGVNSDSYPRESFYADLNHLLRVRTPEVARPGGAFSVPELASAEEYFREHLNTRRRAQLQQLVIQDTKLFGCLIYTELKRLQTDLVRVLQRSVGEDGPNDRLLHRWASRLIRRIESVHREVRSYRERYVWRIKTEPLLIEEEVKRVFLLVDEYLSYRLEAAMVNLFRLLEGYPHHFADILDQIEAILTGELAYRNEHVEASAERAEARRETHYYRLGLLKKYVSEVLFLQTKRINRDWVYRNYIAAFGAALAAAFATLANISTVQMVTGQQDMGLRLVTVLALGVAAYVFKDRIKDLTKDYFNSKIKRLLPDYDVEMYYHHFDQSGDRVETYLGTSQEYVRYLSRSLVPPEVGYVRELGHKAELEPERLEDILHYHKRVRFMLRKELHEHFATAQVRRIHDVLRFDVSRFLAKLDDPKKRLSMYDGERIVTIDAPKVYHLNLVFRYTILQLHEGKPSHRDVEIERLRVILNKKGIVRIETVLPRGKMGYSETLT